MLYIEGSIMAWMQSYDDIIRRDCVNCGIGDRVPKFGTKQYAQMFGNRTMPHMAHYAKLMKRKKKKCHCGGGRCKCHEAIEQGVISPIFNETSSTNKNTMRGDDDDDDFDFDMSDMIEAGFIQDFGLTQDEFDQATGHGTYRTPQFIPEPDEKVDDIPQYAHHPSPSRGGGESSSFPRPQAQLTGLDFLLNSFGLLP